MPRAVITGGAGFLGSHLCRRLLLEGFEIICMDSLLTGRADNVEELQGERFRLVRVDVTNYIHVSGPVDAVLHFASPASPIDYLRYPIQTLKVGALGTHNALGLAKEKGARFLLASTSEVYGNPQVHPQPESYWGHVNPIGPRGVYDEAKRFAEAMSMAYHRAHGLSVRIARIFNVFGPLMRVDDGAEVVAYDPVASEEQLKQLVPGLALAAKAVDVADGAHALVLLTEWAEFNELDPVMLAGRMAYQILVDARNALDARRFADAGFTVAGMGRPVLGRERRGR